MAMFFIRDVYHQSDSRDLYKEGKSMIIRVCVGSSCYLKGSQEIVGLLQKAVAEHHFEDKVSLQGTLCIGKCNRVGVSLQVDDDVFVGITPENFEEFFNQNILNRLIEG